MKSIFSRQSKDSTNAQNTQAVSVDPCYYSQGERWEQSVYRSVTLSRNVWRTVAVCGGITTTLALGALWLMIPLKQMDLVVLKVDNTTGFVEVEQPLKQSGDLTQNEAITRANIVRFLRARETYDPAALNDNFQLASLYSTGRAAKDLADLYASSNPQNPIKVLNADGRINVEIKSIIFLNEQTAAVRFSTNTHSPRGNLNEHWVANVRFRYTSEPMRNDWRFDNPLGFQVTEYRRDQETVGAASGVTP